MNFVKLLKQKNDICRLLNCCWIVLMLPVFTKLFCKPLVLDMNKSQKPYLNTQSIKTSNVKINASGRRIIFSIQQAKIHRFPLTLLLLSWPLRGTNLKSSSFCYYVGRQSGSLTIITVIVRSVATNWYLTSYD